MSLRKKSVRRKQALASYDLASAANHIQEWLTASTHILIGAGAGLSAAAGIDYTDQDNFAQVFPALVQRGFRARYELIGRRAITRPCTAVHPVPAPPGHRSQ